MDKLYGTVPGAGFCMRTCAVCDALFQRRYFAIYGRVFKNIPYFC